MQYRKSQQTLDLYSALSVSLSRLVRAKEKPNGGIVSATTKHYDSLQNIFRNIIHKENDICDTRLKTKRIE